MSEGIQVTGDETGGEVRDCTFINPPEFDRHDAYAIHAAFWEAYEDAAERAKSGMTNSARSKKAPSREPETCAG